MNRPIGDFWLTLYISGHWHKTGWTYLFFTFVIVKQVKTAQEADKPSVMKRKWSRPRLVNSFQRLKWPATGPPGMTKVADSEFSPNTLNLAVPFVSDPIRPALYNSHVSLTFPSWVYITNNFMLMKQQYQLSQKRWSRRGVIWTSC